MLKLGGPHDITFVLRLLLLLYCKKFVDDRQQTEFCGDPQRICFLPSSSTTAVLACLLSLCLVTMSRKKLYRRKKIYLVCTVERMRLEKTFNLLSLSGSLSLSSVRSFVQDYYILVFGVAVVVGSAAKSNSSFKCAFLSSYSLNCSFLLKACQRNAQRML